MPDPIDLRPTGADLRAVGRYLDFLPNRVPLWEDVHAAWLAATLAERRRAARVAIKSKEPGPATQANVAFGAACERIHDLILAGPHDPPPG